MTVGKRILLAIVCGCFFATLLLLIAFTIEMPDKLRGVLLWNVGVFVRLAGNGPLLGYDEQGNPMYEGTPVHLIFGLIGVISTFPIYSVIFFIIFTVKDKLKEKRGA